MKRPDIIKKTKVIVTSSKWNSELYGTQKNYTDAIIILFVLIITWRA